MMKWTDEDIAQAEWCRQWELEQKKKKRVRELSWNHMKHYFRLTVTFFMHWVKGR